MEEEEDGISPELNLKTAYKLRLSLMSGGRSTQILIQESKNTLL